MAPTVRSLRFEENNYGLIILMRSSFMARFSLLYYAGLLISESVISILPAEVGSEFDFNLYKLRG